MEYVVLEKKKTTYEITSMLREVKIRLACCFFFFYFFKDYFLMWTIFNIFTELVAKFLLPYILFVCFDCEACGI